MAEPTTVYLQRLTDTCNPSIEQCPSSSSIFEVEEPAGEFRATVALGVIALINTILPIVMTKGTLGTTISTSLSMTFQYAMSFWRLGNMAIWGLLTMLWPLTYFNIDVVYDFYLTYYKVAGIDVVAWLTGFNTILLLVGANEDSDAWLYFSVYLCTEPLLVFISSFFYNNAF